MQDFLHQERLPDEYLQQAERYFFPLAEQLAAQQRQSGSPIIVGINGSQGSGKSTLASLLVRLMQHQHGLSAIDLSIDDFYLTREKRQALGAEVHPLFATRGVPGTHDIALLQSTLAKLQGTGETAVPRFDKSQDDRHPQEQWPKVTTPLDVVILEGWCMGVSAQPDEALVEPVNELEKTEDPEGTWRSYANTKLRTDYRDLFNSIDAWIMLKAPSFDQVFQWRLEQEQKLADALRSSATGGKAGGNSGNRIMSDAEVARFIQHYQRLTERALSELPAHVDHLYALDEKRKIVSYTNPKAGASA